MKELVLRPMRWMGRWNIAFLLLSVLVFGSQCADAPSPEELASQAAKSYYERLLAGDYEGFLDGRVAVEDIPDGYREQLLVALRQFIAQQQQARQGIVSVSVSPSSVARMDSSLNVMHTFLILSFGDDTEEEIVVPMVEQKGQWRMR